MRITRFGGVVAGILVLAAGALAQTPPIPALPSAVELVYAAPFKLQQEFRSDWHNDRPVVGSGYLVVLRVNPALVFPRQDSQPVLYSGVQTAERINVGYRSGFVVAILPGPLDLARDRIWFGTPMLPEQVTSNTAAFELRRAESAGIRATPASVLNHALRQTLVLANRTELLRKAAELIRQYAPDETELANNLVPIR